MNYCAIGNWVGKTCQGPTEVRPGLTRILHVTVSVATTLVLYSAETQRQCRDDVVMFPRQRWSKDSPAFTCYKE